MDPVLEKLLRETALSSYLISFSRGQILCSEGDDSRDLYILVDGILEVLKGKRKISEIRESGVVVGEISFLLETRRTATVRARTDGRAVCVPKEKVQDFLKEFPALAWRIPRVLARRLDERTRALHGLKEFCDQLPQAVVVADREDRIVSWNAPAESLFGQSWEALHDRPMAELYQDPETYRRLLADLKSSYSPVEAVLEIRHPEQGQRFLSTALSPVFDRHHNLSGVLALSHDVTEALAAQRRYRRFRRWVLPLLFAVLTAAGTMSYLLPRVLHQREITGFKQQLLCDRLAKDYLFLKSLLGPHFLSRDMDAIAAVMQNFFKMQGDLAPYTGILLLDPEKKVFGAYTRAPSNTGAPPVGGSYADIPFEKAPDSIHRVLTVYRVDPENPMGRKGLEVAFQIRRQNRSLDWLLFQMDMRRLEEEFEADEKTLKSLRIRPS